MENKVKIILCAENTIDLTDIVCKINHSYEAVFADIDNIEIENKIKRFDCCDAVFVVGFDDAVSHKILDKWTGHPHLRCIIHKEDSIRTNLVMQEVESLLTPIELEKKFLIKMPDMDLLSSYHPFTVDIEQIYLTCQNGSHRIRKRGALGEFTYFETKKLRITNSKCFEYENTISADEYEQLKTLANPKKHPIVKKRTCFVYNGQYFELDTFAFFRDKALLELELKNEQQSFELPPEIEVVKDVTDDKKYKNNYLAGITDYDNY